MRFLLLAIGVLGSACCFDAVGAGTTGTSGGTGTGSSSGSSSGQVCHADSDCSGGDYCLVPLTNCTQMLNSPFAEGVGTCHRNCSQGACACQDPADCGAGSCNVMTGTCAFAGVTCINPGPCPASCSLQALTQEYCPLCICASCPSADSCSGTVEPDAGIFLPKYAPLTATFDSAASEIVIGEASAICNYLGTGLLPGQGVMTLVPGTDLAGATLFLGVDAGVVNVSLITGNFSFDPSTGVGAYDLSFPGPCAFPPEPCNSEITDVEIGSFVAPASACLCP